MTDNFWIAGMLATIIFTSGWLGYSFAHSRYKRLLKASFDREEMLVKRYKELEVMAKQLIADNMGLMNDNRLLIKVCEEKRQCPQTTLN